MDTENNASRQGNAWQRMAVFAKKPFECDIFNKSTGFGPVNLNEGK